jgi:outer membrane biogenesis lipoprotein LolB
MNNFTIVLLAVAFLSACTTYSDTLEQKLAGKSPEQKRTILAQECRREIESGLKPDNESNVRHFERMRKICEEMTGKKVPVSIPDDKK